jgi:iron complex transport system ATP-binding protein
VTVLGDRYGAVDVRVAPRIGLASSAAATAAPDADRARRGPDGTRRRAEPWWSTYDAADHERADALWSSSAAGHAAQELATLSEGERKRLLVARLLMADPSCSCSTSRAGLDLGGRESLVALLGDWPVTTGGRS